MRLLITGSILSLALLLATLNAVHAQSAKAYNADYTGTEILVGE